MAMNNNTLSQPSRAKMATKSMTWFTLRPWTGATLDEKSQLNRSQMRLCVHVYHSTEAKSNQSSYYWTDITGK